MLGRAYGAIVPESLDSLNFGRYFLFGEFAIVVCYRYMHRLPSERLIFLGPVLYGRPTANLSRFRCN